MMEMQSVLFGFAVGVMTMGLFATWIVGMSERNGRRDERRKASGGES